MAIETDPNPALRAELTAAFDALQPSLRGLDDLTHSSLSQQLESAVAAELATLRRRAALVTDVVRQLDGAQSAMEALVADGYPDEPPSSIIPDLYAELQVQLADFAAAAARFASIPQAVALNVSLGTPATKP